MTRLPVLLSIPHGGLRVPDELSGRTALSAADIMDDIDLFTPELYDLGNSVRHVFVAEIARPFVDLNREPGQLPPEHPDGVIKSHTCFNVPVYQPGRQPDAALVRNLLRRYHAPYHSELERWLRDPGVALMLDCHSMSEYPPPIAPDRSERRPLLNLGDADGNACPRPVTARFARCLVDAFSVDEREVTINRPFRGGYITRRYGGNPRPVIQVEVNRALYFDPADPHRRDAGRIESVRTRFEAALRELCAHPVS